MRSGARANRRAILALALLLAWPGATAWGAAPTLTSISPAAGPPGTTLQLSGSGFGAQPGSVTFSPPSGPATVAGVTYWSATQVAATVPSLPPGEVSVSVYSPQAGGSNALPFTVTGWSVLKGSYAGWTAQAPNSVALYVAQSASAVTASVYQPPDTSQNHGCGNAGLALATSASAAPYLITHQCDSNFVIYAPDGHALTYNNAVPYVSGELDTYAASVANGQLTVSVTNPAGTTSRLSIAWPQATFLAGLSADAAGKAASFVLDGQPVSVPPAPPQLTLLDPARGPVSGGNAVTLYGAGMEAATGASFGGKPALTFQVVSDAEAVAVAPPGTGSVPVAVTSAAGNSTAAGADQYAYVPAVTSVSPSTGSPLGGTQVAIAGAGFTGASAVYFGTRPAAGFQVVSDGLITATAPPGGGTVDVTVVGPQGPSDLGPADRFTYSLLAPPAIRAVQPDGAPAAGGSPVLILGSGFAPQAQVRIGGRPAGGVQVNAAGTAIQATAPPGAGTVPLTVSDPAVPVGLAAAGQTAYARMSDGSVLAWGQPPRGDGYADAPVAVPGLTDVVQVAVSRSFAVALRADGTVWSWGSIVPYSLGQNQSPQQGADSAIPLQVPGLTDVVQVAAGSNPATMDGFALALRRDGSVWEWGTGIAGGTATPQPVPGLSDVVAVAVSTGAGTTAYALRADGTVWAWGDNHRGQVGDGTTTTRSAPVPVTGLTGVTAIAAGIEDGYALRADGTVWAWGAGCYGELGNGAPLGGSCSDSPVPVQVQGLTGVTAIAAGGVSAYYQVGDAFARTRDGTVWAWGAVLGGSGACCAFQGTSTPVPVTGLPGNVTALAALGNDGVAYALGTDGRLWAWGMGPYDNSNGQLGNGTTARPSGPVAVSLTDVAAVAGGYEDAVALRGDGTVWEWGDPAALRFAGWIGSGLGGPYPVPVSGLSGATAIAAGSPYGGLGFALTADGSGWAWGGSGPNNPQQVNQAGTVTAIRALDPHGGAVVRADGTVWQYPGGNALGSTPAEVSLPAGVSATAVVTMVGDWTLAFALDGSGDVYAWGWSCNSNGCTPPSTVSPVPGLSQVVAIDASGLAGNPTLFALRADGTLWSVPVGPAGGPSGVSLGQPTQVAGLSDVRAVAAGGEAVYALRADGSLWAWGSNNYGALGVGQTPSQLPSSATPVQVSGLSGVVAVAAGSDDAFALTADGRVWAWGGGYGGNPAVPGGGSDVPVPVAGFDLSSTLASTPFTYVAPGGPAPTVASVSPDTGPAAGGTTVTVGGSGFTVATAVYFGATPAQSFAVLGDSQLTAVSPPGSGTVDVTVASPNGTSAAVPADRFTYQSPVQTAVPAVTAVSPASGPAGTRVVVTGSGFTGATAVDFGAVPAASFSVQGDGQLLATAPAQPAGVTTVDVTVTGPGGTSAAVPADRFTYQTTAGPPASLAFSGQTPAWLALQTPYAPGTAVTVTLAVYDQAGNLASANGDTIALALLPAAGGATVWSSTATAAGGLATFTVGPLAVTAAQPGSGFVLRASDVTHPGVPAAVSAPLDLLFPWPLFASSAALTTPQGTALAIWGDRLPPPGVGDDSGELLPWSFGGVDASLAYTAGEHVLLSGDPLGQKPFCVDGTWSLAVRGGSAQSLSGSGCSGPVDLATLGLPAGDYGLQLTLEAPSTGTSYGSSDVFLLAAGAGELAEEPLPQAHRPLVLKAAATPLTVGVPASVPVTVASIPLPVSYLHFALSYDPAGIELTGLTPPSGWSGGLSGFGSGGPGSGQYSASAGSGVPPLQVGDTAFTLQLTCRAPGTWALSFLSGLGLGSGGYLDGIVHGFAQPIEYQREVSGLLSVTCVAPPPGPTSATGVAVNPSDGTLTVTLTGSGLDQAASAALVDPSGATVATSVYFPTRLPTLLTVGFPVTPAGLDTLEVYDAAGHLIASTSQPLAVPPAVPVFTLSRSDLLNQVPGFQETHFWRLTNWGTTDGVAIVEWLFPTAIDTPVPVLSAMPSGTEVLLTGSGPEGWEEVLAVPVAAGSSADLAWTVTLPPSQTFGTDASFPLGSSLTLNALPRVYAGVRASSWSTVGAAGGVATLQPALAEQDAEWSQALSELNAMDVAEVDTYTQQLRAVYPSLAAELLGVG